MINIDNIIEFDSIMNLTEEQIYELIKNIHKDPHTFALQIKYFYCTLLKNDYFDIADSLVNKIHGDNLELKQFAQDLYQYCKNHKNHKI